MKVSNIKFNLKHYLSTMVICGSYMFEFSVSEDMKENNNDKRRERGRDREILEAIEEECFT